MNSVSSSSLFSIASGAGLECVSIEEKHICKIGKLSCHANIICNKVFPNAGPKECKLTVQKCV